MGHQKWVNKQLLNGKPGFYVTIQAASNGSQQGRAIELGHAYPMVGIHDFLESLD